MPNNRMWMFNPGCAPDPCCSTPEPNLVPCCGCDASVGYSGPIDLTSSYGTVSMTKYGSEWRSCQAITRDRTYLRIAGTNGCDTSSYGSGTTHVQFSLTCGTDGRPVLNQVFYGQNCGPGTNQYINRDTFCFNDAAYATQNPLIANVYNVRGTLVSIGDEIEFSFPEVTPGFPAITGTVTITSENNSYLGVPTTLYLNDGFGEVPLVYNGPRPVSLATASDMWWGCATRHVTGGREKAQSGDCEPTPVDFDTGIVFGLWCKGPSEGYRLYIFHDGCGYYDDGINVQTHQRESLGCTTPWIGQLNQIVAGSINGIAASDCSPFVWGPHSQNFPASPSPYHPLREIYGDSGTWIITS